MGTYRRKPVTVEAVQFDPQQPWHKAFKPWPDEHGIQPRDMSWGYVETPNGREHVCARDWIITNDVGEHMVCGDEIFKATFDPVKDSEPSSSLQEQSDTIETRLLRIKAAAMILPLSPQSSLKEIHQYLDEAMHALINVKGELGLHTELDRAKITHP